MPVKYTKYDKQEWVLDYLSNSRIPYVDITNEDFVNEYIQKFNPKKVGYQPYGADTVPELGRLLGDMHRCNMLNRFTQGLSPISVADGFPKWVYVYSVKKHNADDGSYNKWLREKEDEEI